MNASPVDLNADLGEGFGVWRLGDDDALLGVVTSANVACGFHAGDPQIMTAVCQQARAVGVVVGAQVSYRDLAGFGRRRLPVDPADLQADIVYQLGALQAIALSCGTSVGYVKAHGALYNAAADDRELAGALAAAVAPFALPLLGLPGSAMQSAAESRGLPFVAEGFADRAYTPTGRLVDRAHQGAVFSDPDQVAAQAVRLAATGVRSICVHGDTPGAVELARRVRDALTGAGYELRAFSPGAGSCGSPRR